MPDTGTGIGAAVRRKEDLRFITGGGQYTDDMSQHGELFAAFVRSPHAHAIIKKVDTSKAAKAPGVVAIFTGADLAAVNGLPCGWLITSTDGTPMKEPKHAVLASDKVRHVGDQLALVIAETREQAKDAAELIEVEYDDLPAVADTTGALAPGAARCTPRRRAIWPSTGITATRPAWPRRSARPRAWSSSS